MTTLIASRDTTINGQTIKRGDVAAKIDSPIELDRLAHGVLGRAFVPKEDAPTEPKPAPSTAPTPAPKAGEK